MKITKQCLLIFSIFSTGLLQAMDSTPLSSTPTHDTEVFALELIPANFELLSKNCVNTADLPTNVVQDLAQGYVASFNSPETAVHHLKNLLQTKAEWRILLSDLISMRNIAEILVKKFNISLLNALLLLNTNGAKKAHEQEIKRNFVKSQVKKSLFYIKEHYDGYDKSNHEAHDFPEHYNSALITVLKETLMSDQVLLDFFIQEVMKAYGQKTVADTVMYFTGQEEPTFLDLLFHRIDPTEFQRCQKGLQFLLSKAINHRNVLLVRELLGRYHANPNAPITECIPNLLPGQSAVYQGLTPMHFACVLKDADHKWVIDPSVLLKQPWQRSPESCMIMANLIQAGGIIPTNSTQLKDNLDNYKNPPQDVTILIARD